MIWNDGQNDSVRGGDLGSSCIFVGERVAGPSGGHVEFWTAVDREKKNPRTVSLSAHEQSGRQARGSQKNRKKHNKNIDFARFLEVVRRLDPSLFPQILHPPLPSLQASARWNSPPCFAVTHTYTHADILYICDTHSPSIQHVQTSLIFRNNTLKKCLSLLRPRWARLWWVSPW